MTVDRRMVEHLVKEIEASGVDPSELTVVKTSALNDLQKENAELRGEIEGEVEELASPDSREVVRGLLEDYFSSTSEDDGPTEAEELEDQIRRMKGRRGDKWTEAAERLEGEMEELSDSSDPSPKGLAQSRREEPQDDEEDDRTLREKLDDALRQDIQNNRSSAGGKSPLSQNIEEEDR
jgi:hypothetical protein